jgi:hypothetical protein
MVRVLLLFGAIALVASESSSVEPSKQPELTADESCNACHLFVDTFYLQLRQFIDKEQRALRAGNQKVLNLKQDQLTGKLCADLALQPTLYGQKTIDQCHAFQAAKAADISSHVTMDLQDKEQQDTYFQIKKNLCGPISASCVPKSERKSISPCHACESLMSDVLRTLHWADGRKSFGTSKHAYRVLEDVCAHIPVRYPLAVHESVKEMCGATVDEHSSDIAKAISKARDFSSATFLNNRICTQLTEVCEDDEL